MYPSGITISQLITILQKLKKEHGDVQVFSGGTDYPGGVSGASYNEKDRIYTPSNTVTIWTH